MELESSVDGSEVSGPYACFIEPCWGVTVRIGTEPRKSVTAEIKVCMVVPADYSEV